MFNWVKRKKWLVVNAVLVGILVSLLGIQVVDTSDAINRSVKIGIGNEKVITLGHVAYAAGSVDYTYDGVDDDVQFQAALDALPVTGGRLVDVSAVQKNFAATVTRAIPNVTITGSGAGSYFVNDGGTALFTAGGNGWHFENLRTDAGSLNMGATTGGLWTNVTIDTQLYTYHAPTAGIGSIFDLIADNSLTVSSLTSGRVPVAGAGGLLGDNASLTYDGSTDTDIATYQDLGALGASAWLIASDASANISAYATILQAAGYPVWVTDGAADDVEVQAAIASLPSSGGTIAFSAGTFFFTSQVTIQKNGVRIVGQGDSTVFDFTGLAAGNIGIYAYGAVTATNSLLTVDATAGVLTVTVADGSLFTANDWVRIRSEALFNGGTQKYGEIREIESVGGNVITISEPLSYAYAQADTATVDLLTVYEGIAFENFKMLATNAENQSAISASVLSDLSFEHLTIEDFADRAIDMNNVVIAKVADSTFIRSNRAGTGYGVRTGDASRDIVVSGSMFSDNRHSVTIGGTTYGVQSNIVIKGNTAQYSSQNQAAFNTKNVARGVLIEGNSVWEAGLAIVSCLDVSIVNNLVYIYTTAADAVYLTTGAGNVRIADNHIEVHSNRRPFHAAFETSHVTIDNNHLIATGSEPAIESLVGGSDYVISNNDIESSGGQEGIRFTTDAATAIAYRLKITGNTVYTDSASGIALETDNAMRIVDVDILNNTVRPGAHGLALESGGLASEYYEYVHIQNNSILGGNRGMYIFSVRYLDISGNFIRDTSSHGIELKSTAPANAYYYVNGNSIHNPGAAAIDDEPQDANSTIFEQYVDVFMSVLAVSATYVRSNEDLSAGIPITFTLDAQPDVPRTLSGHFDSHAQITAYTIVITGVDTKGFTITENKTDADGWDWETSNAFATITSIVMAARTGTGAGDTMDIGVTDVLGLSNRISATGDVYKIKKNVANATVAAAQVNATYDTYDMAVIGLAATDNFTIWYRSSLNIVS